MAAAKRGDSGGRQQQKGGGMAAAIMIMHTCTVIARTCIHALRAFTPCAKRYGNARGFHTHFRERKLPLRAWAGRAVLARLVRAPAGVWACCALMREGRACLLVAGDWQAAW